MPFITREDNERFVIPSYRDTMSAKKDNLLKKEVVLLSSNYGEYIALQKKSPTQYEVAFSPDSGYLLGECVWNHFNRPADMIYCEEIPNTTEAILVIVKSGSVYLDGSFQIDSIPEELVIFKTQQNHFAIYISGNVPISQVPEDGKISFDANSVKSFEELSTPAFPKLPTVKAFQLQLVDTVLKAYGIGVLPIKQVIAVVIIGGLAYFGYDYISTHQKELPTTFVQVQTNPFQSYLDQLSSPDPAKQLHQIAATSDMLYSVPGWEPTSFEYTPGVAGKLHVMMHSLGGDTTALLQWANRRNIQADLMPDGIGLTLVIVSSKRDEPTSIYNMQDVLSTLTDRLSVFLAGSPLQFSSPPDKKDFTDSTITIPLNNVTASMLDIIGQYLDGLPVVLVKMSGRYQSGQIGGTISLKALGN